MEPSNTPARKYNPYYLPEPEGCGKRTNCPYKAMPEHLRAVDFANQPMMEFSDSYCSTCERKLKLVPPPPSTPPPPPPTPPAIKPPVVQPEPQSWIRKYWWLIALLLVLIAGLIYSFILRKKFCEEGFVVAGKETCVNGVKYNVKCDGKGGFVQGDSIGTCGEVVCDSGTVAETFCKNGDQYFKICDGKGGFIEKLNKAKSPDCPQPTPPQPKPKPKPGLVVIKPGVPYIVDRGGVCTIEIFDSTLTRISQKKLEPDDPRCAKAIPGSRVP